MIRFEHSEVLFNNLRNSNNLTPFRSLEVEFNQLKQIIVPGYMEADIKLD